MTQKKAREHIKYMRKILLLSQKEFGKRLGVSAATICNWEQGKHKISKKGMDAIELMTNNPPIYYSEVNKFSDGDVLVIDKDNMTLDEKYQFKFDSMCPDDTAYVLAGGKRRVGKLTPIPSKEEVETIPQKEVTMNFEKHYMFKVITIAGKEYLVPPDDIIVRDATIDDRKFVLLHFEYAKSKR